ncbi:hypothetical protein JCM30237_27690 [Halolamina litorea]|uniref:Uncharacterized protein n=1 Tax=Halolamina litorea TaxID=1515593 RepID=A0ABD6BT71_9EURY|nr:hypothetical protein [Halolamina litorea]
MANVVTGFRDAIDALRQRFTWADPVFLAWAITMSAVLLSAEAFHQEYDMLIATLRILFYLTLFDLVIGIPDEQTDTPNTEQLFTILSALGAGGLGYSIEVTASAVAGDMTAAQLLGLSVFISRVYANYSTTDLTFRESMTGDGPVTHPYITTFAALAIMIPFGLKLWVFLFGKAAAPDVHSPSTYALVAGSAATVAFVSYYLNNGMTWGEATGRDAAEAAKGADDSDATPAAPTATADTADPRRTESGFEFPAQDESAASNTTADNPVADHPVARQSRGEQD